MMAATSAVSASSFAMRALLSVRSAPGLVAAAALAGDRATAGALPCGAMAGAVPCGMRLSLAFLEAGACDRACGCDPAIFSDLGAVAVGCRRTRRREGRRRGGRRRRCSGRDRRAMFDLRGGWDGGHARHGRGGWGSCLRSGEDGQAVAGQNLGTARRRWGHATRRAVCPVDRHESRTTADRCEDHGSDSVAFFGRMQASWSCARPLGDLLERREHAGLEIRVRRVSRRIGQQIWTDRGTWPRCFVKG